MSPQTPKQPPEQPTLEQLIRLPMVFKVPGIERVDQRADLVYRRVGDEELEMDVYAPPGLRPGETRPAVIFVHGGPTPRTMPLPPKEWGVFVGYGRSAAMAGLAGVTFNHRFFAVEDLADAESDVMALVDHVRENAAELGIDGQRLGLWVFSGGGPFLAEFLRHPRPYVRALVAFYALLDLRPLLAMVGGAADEATSSRLSPVLALEAASGEVPPMFIGRAGLDNPGVNGTIDQFAGLALKKNLQLTVANHARGHHGFDARDDDARSREIIRQAFDFLNTHL
jgi:acetyl esterase/lipase